MTDTSLLGIAVFIDLRVSLPDIAVYIDHPIPEYGIGIIQNAEKVGGDDRAGDADIAGIVDRRDGSKTHLYGITGDHRIMVVYHHFIFSDYQLYTP
jgi:hypothetical protein